MQDFSYRPFYMFIVRIPIYQDSPSVSLETNRRRRGNPVNVLNIVSL
jgi:hypothetical protein